MKRRVCTLFLTFIFVFSFVFGANAVGVNSVSPKFFFEYDLPYQDNYVILDNDQKKQTDENSTKHWNKLTVKERAAKVKEFMSRYEDWWDEDKESKFLTELEKNNDGVSYKKETKAETYDALKHGINSDEMWGDTYYKLFSEDLKKKVELFVYLDTDEAKQNASKLSESADGSTSGKEDEKPKPQVPATVEPGKKDDGPAGDGSDVSTGEVSEDVSEIVEMDDKQKFYAAVDEVMESYAALNLDDGDVIQTKDFMGKVKTMFGAYLIAFGTDAKDVIKTADDGAFYSDLTADAPSNNTKLFVILTVVFGVLAVAGIGAAVFFFLKTNQLEEKVDRRERKINELVNKMDADRRVTVQNPKVMKAPLAKELNDSPTREERKQYDSNARGSGAAWSQYNAYNTVRDIPRPRSERTEETVVNQRPTTTAFNHAPEYTPPTRPAPSAPSASSAPSAHSAPPARPTPPVPSAPPAPPVVEGYCKVSDESVNAAKLNNDYIFRLERTKEENPISPYIYYSNGDLQLNTEFFAKSGRSKSAKWNVMGGYTVQISRCFELYSQSRQCAVTPEQASADGLDIVDAKKHPAKLNKDGTIDGSSRGRIILE